MISRAFFWPLLWVLVPSEMAFPLQQQAGSVRGVVYDKDFDAPLPGARVAILETEQEATTSDQGNYVFGQVVPGNYTLVFSKDGYVRQLVSDVVVAAGKLTDVDAWLAGEFTEMEEFVVQDIQIGGGTEIGLLNLRFESPSLMDSISSDLMSRAGASDAASALRLVTGATVEDGKFAVIRGLPDRYVSNQLNGVRLPTADEEKRAVELDQFPAAVIESIQVSKTFTPDQQGDASGGAVDVVLEGIPDETVLEFKSQYSYNSQVADAGDHFLINEGSGEDPQTEGENWDGPVGVKEGDSPTDYKLSTAIGGSHLFDNGVKVGGQASLFYERDSFYDGNGKDYSYWRRPGSDELVPETSQGFPEDDTFKTKLFDVTRSSESEQWAGLGTFGVETENHALGLNYLYTRVEEKTAILAEDNNGKHYFFPGYNPDDPTTPGHSQPGAAPYLRTETLEYNERTTGTFQVTGRHVLREVGPFDAPELDWSFADSYAKLDQPDKRQFGSVWFPAREPLPGLIIPPTHRPLNPAANINLGNLQRIFKEIREDSDQYAVNLRLPFEQWSGDDGFFKVGFFEDHLDRHFDQDTYSNFGDSDGEFEGDFDEFWSDVFPGQDGHEITAAETDVDYKGKQKIPAWYTMVDVPLTSQVNLIGGARFERTKLSIVNDAEADALWFPEGNTAPESLDPGEADVSVNEHDILPAVGLSYTPIDSVTLRASYSETIARQTFRELTPIVQQEYLGGPIFIGNPDLQMSQIKNYDLRLDFTPYEGGLISVSWFYKNLDDPIEFIQRVTDSFTFTTPVNYPEGTLDGWEFEIRQDLDRFWSPLAGLSLGANATFIDSEVTLPDEDVANLDEVNSGQKTRDATNAPDHLYNLYLNYDIPNTGTRLSLFYTVRGDTLIAGANQEDGNYVPNVYEKEYGTLNFSLSQRINGNIDLSFQAKNLTNPDIETEYRSDFIADEKTQTSISKGREFSLALSLSF